MIKMRVILFLIIIINSFAIFPQFKREDITKCINNLETIQLENYVLLTYKSKNNYTISFYVPKSKVEEIKKFSKNTDTFLENIFTVDSVYYDHYWFFTFVMFDKYISDRVNIGSEHEKKLYNIYMENYNQLEKWESSFTIKSQKKINNRISIYEVDCEFFFTGHINSNCINYFVNNISIDFIRLKWNNIQVPFVFGNYQFCREIFK